MRLTAIFLFAGVLSAQVSNVRVLGTSPTQALVAFTAPDTGVCTLAASLTADANGNPTAPLVADVDPAVFTGADQDSRAGNVTNGRARTFVIGKRAAEIAADGNYTSRALQAASGYYGKITCGASTAVFTFQTANIPLGIGYGDPWPTDANNPGEWAAPATAGAPGEFFVEPQTGAKVLRNTYPGASFTPVAPTVFDTAYDQGQQPCDSAGPWTTPCNAVGTSAYTSVSGSNAWLVLRANNYAYYHGTDATLGPNLVQFQLTAKAYSSAAGDQADVCLSMNAGASCATPIITVALPTTAGTITAGTKDQVTQAVDSWLYSSRPHISRWLSSIHKGNTTVSGSTVTNTGGDPFYLDWMAGGAGRLRLSTVSTTDACTNGTDLSIASVDSGTQITLTSPPGDITGYYCAPNFAVMVRAHSGNTGTFYLNTAKFAGTLASSGEGVYGGAQNGCNDTPVSGGYLCNTNTGGGGSALTWTDATTGQTNMIGPMWANAKSSGANRWARANCPGSGPQVLSTFDTTQATPTWYCVANDSAGKPSILRVVYTGSLNAQNFSSDSSIGAGGATTDDYTATYSNATITDLTPGSLSQDLKTQAETLLGYTLDSMTCEEGPFVSGLLSLYCYKGQNTMGWMAAFDPGDGDPAHAGQVGGPRVVGVMPSWGGGAGTPNRWNGIHSIGYYGASNPPVFGYGSENIPAGSNTPEATSSIITTNTAIPATAVDCATYGNPMGKTGVRCIQLQINANGGSYEPYYWQSVGSGEVMPLSPAQTPGIPSNALLGDLFCVTATSLSCSPNTYYQESMRLIQKGANGLWVFYRNALNDLSGLRAITGTGTKYLVAWNNAQNPQEVCGNGTYIGGQIFWTPTTDPLGQAVARDPQGCNAHSVVRPWLMLEASQIGDGSYTMRKSTTGLPGIFTATPSILQTNSPFHGVPGAAVANVWQSHPSAAGNQATDYERQAAFDVRPLEGFYTSAPANADLYTKVSGNLYKATPGAVTDPDNVTFGNAKLHRKVYATAASAGMHPLLDISGPSSSIDGTSAHAYQYCYVRANGECYAGSTVGQIYANVPGLVYPYCNGNNTYGTTVPQSNDICITDMPAVGGGIVQMSTNYPDPGGLFSRVLAKAMVGPPKSFIGTYGLATLPSGFVMYNGNYLDGLTRGNYLVQLPPFPALDSVNRGDFVPVPVSLNPPPGVDNAVIEFGYREFNGNCTTRNEACVAKAPAINSVPFQFRGENPPGAPCAAGCTIVIPAVSQRILYYRVKFRNAANGVLSVTPDRVLVTP